MEIPAQAQRQVDRQDLVLNHGAQRDQNNAGHQYDADAYSTLKAEYSDFGELLQRFASLQIRNQVNHHGQGTMKLRDLQRQIGTARQQASLRVSLV